LGEGSLHLSLSPKELPFIHIFSFISHCVSIVGIHRLLLIIGLKSGLCNIIEKRSGKEATMLINYK
jgi:hypothetical protein